MAGDRRVDAVEYSMRINAAVQLVQAGVSVAEAVAVLADRFGVSRRQARRYVERAGAGGRMPVPEASGRTVPIAVTILRLGCTWTT